MTKKEIRVSYIDYENISVWFRKMWKYIDWGRFYIYLKDKYKITNSKIFIWYIEQNKNIYTELASFWYDLIFRDAIIWWNGRIKSNIDTDLVLEASIDYYENSLSWAILVSCDWDFDCLIKFWYQKNIFLRLFATKQWDISLLLKKNTKALDIIYISDIGHDILKEIKKDQ